VLWETLQRVCNSRLHIIILYFRTESVENDRGRTPPKNSYRIELNHVERFCGSVAFKFIILYLTNYIIMHSRATRGVFDDVDYII